MLRSIFTRTAKYVLRRAGYEIRKINLPVPVIPDQPAWVHEIIARVQPYTFTSPERIASLCNAVEYIVRCNIPGDIVECGVWKGGSMMAAALTLLRCGDTQREVYLFDTFEGMSAPTEVDLTSYHGADQTSYHPDKFSGAEILARFDLSGLILPLEEVRHNLSSVGYPDDRIKLVKGPVEATLPNKAPSKIALLRLDTDWYESTRHELIHLYPRLAQRGVLIIDDYGHWEGAQKAVDEYIRDNNLPVLLNRIDYTGRIAIKP
jgi:hypothetical protein